MKNNPCFNLRKFGMVMPFFREAFHMSMSRLQELLDEQKLSLQELSDRSGLPIDTIQAIEPQVQGVFTNLQKISQSLNTTVPKLFELFSIPKEPDRPQESPIPGIPRDNRRPDGLPSEEDCKRARQRGQKLAGCPDRD